MTRLAVIATHPIQYHVPVWRSLTQYEDLDVRVFYGSDFSIRGYQDSGFGVSFKWDVPLTDGYSHTFLCTDPRPDGLGGFFSLRAKGLQGHLDEFNPDCALIGAYSPSFWWEAVWMLRRNRIPILIRSEATDAALVRSSFRRTIRTNLLRLFYSQCSRFLVIGEMARQHYLAHGVSPERIFRSPYCVDTELFSKQVEQYAPQRSHLRHALGFRDQDTVFLFSGKLIEKKDPLTLARAFQGFSSEQQDRTGLIVVGDGELRPIVEALCKQALGERSRFVGFVNQSQLGQYYACADCLVLPSVSGETWGLVVNEALQFGIPAIVSDRVGCHPDLIVNGQSGFIFRAGDIHDLKDSMTRCMGWLAQDQARIAENCRRQVVEYTVQQAAKGIYEAVCSLE